MQPEDAPRCAELEQLLFPGEVPWSAEAFLTELRQPHNHYVTARAERSVTARAERSVTARAERSVTARAERSVGAREGDDAVLGYAGIARLGRASDPENEVHTIGVDPAQQRHGIGRLLLDELLRVADTHGGDTWLEVRTDNEAAQALYRRAGFVVVGTRPRYYQPSGADAYSMRRPAHQVVRP